MRYLGVKILSQSTVVIDLLSFLHEFFIIVGLFKQLQASVHSIFILLFSYQARVPFNCMSSFLVKILWRSQSFLQVLWQLDHQIIDFLNNKNWMSSIWWLFLNRISHSWDCYDLEDRLGKFVSKIEAFPCVFSSSTHKFT